jgi:hypothetical protein
MSIQRPRSDACLFGNVLQAGIRSRARELPPGHFQQAGAIALRIRAGLPISGETAFPGHI